MNDFFKNNNQIDLYKFMKHLEEKYNIYYCHDKDKFFIQDSSGKYNLMPKQKLGFYIAEELYPDHYHLMTRELYLEIHIMFRMSTKIIAVENINFIDLNKATHTKNKSDKEKDIIQGMEDITFS